MKYFLTFILIIIPLVLFPHGEEKHKNKVQPVKLVQKITKHLSENKQHPIKDNPNMLRQIDLAYQKGIKPIFEQKCYNCHGNQTNFTWYSKIPGVKQFIENDIAEAKEHLDMSTDFPFGGHGTPFEDLKSLASTVLDDSMPPMMYKIAHEGSSLNEDEKLKILAWIDSSKKLLLLN
jgi:hypothetical protein